MSTAPKDRDRTQEGHTQAPNDVAQTGEKIERPSDQLAGTADRVEQSQQMPDWYIFKGSQAKDAGTDEAPPLKLPPAPPWRDFGSNRPYKGATFRASPEEIRVVNAAIHLRRPLLLTGLPGTGKSSLAYAVADELGLGEVLVWPITSRSQLKDGLYSYDAIGRLQASNLSRSPNDRPLPPPPIGEYLRLGPLGTALADSRQDRPRVLLIDEIDKSDIDLPNDLLNVFEDGEFEIQELARLARARGDTDKGATIPAADQRIQVRLHQPRDKEGAEEIEIIKGRVRCIEFPIVFLTSNGERALPAPFLRRCLRLDIRPPNEAKLQKIVRAHFDELKKQEQLPDEVLKLIKKVVERRNSGNREYVATDQLMNAIHLVLNHIDLTTLPEKTSDDSDRRDSKPLIEFILEAIGTSLV